MASYKERCTFATLPRTERGKPLVLGADPKGKKFLYTNDKTVIIRDIENAAISDLYSEHSYPVYVAKYSPSGFYIASGDNSGKVRIWDTVNKEHILKAEYPVLGGCVKDVSWDSQSQKLAVAGDGRESYAKCINIDTGTSVGDLTGNTKQVNSVAFRPARPFRIVTASEDFTSQLFEGPPFKKKGEKHEHTNFCQAVRFSPDGKIYITVGSDCKAHIYDGQSGDYLGCLGGKEGEKDVKAHGGGIYALDFNKDGSELLTVSGDKSAKIWDMATRQVVTEFKLGKDINDMQLGCVWIDDNIITVSLSGYITYLDRNNPERPLKVLKGHNKSILALALSEDRSKIYSSGQDGKVFCWDANTGLAEEFKGKGHNNTQIQDMAIHADILYSIGMDDSLRLSRASQNEFSADATKLPSLPKALALQPDGTCIISCANHVVVTHNGKIMSKLDVKFEPMGVDIHPGGTTVAVGSSHGGIHIFKLSNYTLTEGKHIKSGNQGTTALRYSPDGAYLVTVGTEKIIELYRLDGSEPELVNSLKRHSARIDAVSWSPDSEHFATAGLDQDIFVWGVNDFNKADPLLIKVKFAHKLSQVTRVMWLNNNVLVSCGRDANIKQWELSF